MDRIRINLLVLCLFFAAAITSFECAVHEGDPQSLPSEVLDSPAVEYTEAVEHARLLARDLIIEDNLPGISVAIAVNNELVWAEGFGWADLKVRIPITPHTQFRIGSTTKSLTAAAAGLLYERGLLDLDIPVQEYVPEFPKKQWEISTRQLMGHVAGIRHYRDGSPLGEEEPFSNEHYENVLESLEVFADAPLLFRPSTAYSYSSYGWVLVGAVIQAVAGEPYINFMEREIFKPLGMIDTMHDYANREMPNIASFYWPRMARNTHLGLENASRVDLSGKLPAGGYISTPIDLVRFGMAMLEGSLLKPETLEMLRTVQELTSGETTGSGLGWHVRSVSIGENSNSSLMMSCPGSGVGGTTSFVIFPEKSMVIAVVSNVSFAKGLSPFTKSLASLFNQER